MMTSGLLIAYKVSIGLRRSILQCVVALAHIVLSAMLLSAATLAIAMV